MNRIASYEDLKSRKLGSNIEIYSAKELAEYFIKQTSKTDNEIIDFIGFVYDIIRKYPNKGNSGIYQTIINSIKKFTGREKLGVNEISFKFLTDYGNYLASKHTDTAKKKGQIIKPMTASGINLYIRTFQALFNKARETYNDEEKNEILIPNNPFKKYKAPEIPETEKLALTLKQIKQIRDSDGLVNPRAILARDIFMLSFYLIGMNTADMYFVNEITNNRIGYNRTKTKSRRKDKAFISIAVEPEAMELIEKYKDHSGERLFKFHKMYSEARAFNKAVNIGLKEIAAKLNMNFNLKYYAARHSWATIARNDCGISKDDIHEALNHSDPAMKITDIYIKKDLSVIDRANRKVLDSLIALY